MAASSNVVLEKMKRLEAYAHKPIEDQSIRKLAHELTDRELLFNRFEHLVRAVVEEEIQTAISDYETSFSHDSMQDLRSISSNLSQLTYPQQY